MKTEGVLRANRVDEAQLLGKDDETPRDSKEKGMILFSDKKNGSKTGLFCNLIRRW